MKNVFKKDRQTTGRPDWRRYQKRLQGSPGHFTKRRSIAAIATAAAVIISLYLGFSSSSAGLSEPVVDIQAPQSGKLLISKKDVRLLLHRTPLNELLTDRITLPFKNERFQVETSFDLDLQNRLVEAMDRKNSRFIGVVVMEADSGKILSLAGFNKTDADDNPCLLSVFPAASLFKIVTAAAVVDKERFTCDTPVRFNGYKHTLYKSQLKETRNAYTNTVSFADSFAQSINPVFGKIGKLRLKKQGLEEYGSHFGFNQPIDFELPVAPSHLAIDDSPYHWAEIASGFNNETRISPVHAAMIVSAVLNQGRMIAPSVVERIIDASGRDIYLWQPSAPAPAMQPGTSAVLAELMEATVRSGTARGQFKGSHRDPVLSKLRIGGKTGSINNRGNDVRFDWFVCYAQAKEGPPGGLVIASLVAHEDFIGVRAGTYARMAIKHYFKNQLARQESRAGKADI